MCIHVSSDRVVVPDLEPSFQSNKSEAILFAIISDQDVVNQRLQLITLDQILDHYFT